jgi:hypothetical protein
VKVYISHAGDYDYEGELYAPLKQSPIASRHELFFPHDPKNVNLNTKDIVKSCGLMLAEVSRPSTGQGIEIGRAEAAGVPVLCCYKAGSKISGSLKFVTSDFIVYKDTEDLLQKLAGWLAGK